MKVLILAAGRGSRLAEVTAAKPKALTEVLGKSILARQLDILKEAGVSEIAAATGYRAELLDSFFSTTFYNANWAKSNMVRSLLNSAAYWQNEDVLLSYSDILYHASTIKALKESRGDIVISFDENWLMQWQARFDDPLEDAETFTINSQGQLTEIGQTPSSIEQVKGQFMGLLKITPRGMQIIQRYLNQLDDARIDQLDMTSLLQQLINQQVTVNTVANHHFWFEIDNQKDLVICEQLLQKQ